MTRQYLIILIFQISNDRSLMKEFWSFIQNCLRISLI